MGFSSLDTKPCGYDSAWRITCSLSYSLHRYRPACSVRGANPCSPSVPQRRALENARSAGTKAFRRGVYACGWSCASLNYSSQAHPSNSAARNGFLFNVPASATSRIGDSTRADSALSHPSCQRSADTPYRQIRLSTLRCHKVPIDSDLVRIYSTAGISLLLRRRIYQGICRASNQYCPRVLPGFSCISPVAYRKCMSVTLLGLLVGIATDK